VGDASLGGRVFAVASALKEHLAPSLVGKDAGRVEDIWREVYHGTYWGGGLLPMTAQLEERV